MTKRSVFSAKSGLKWKSQQENLKMPTAGVYFKCRTSPSVPADTNFGFLKAHTRLDTSSCKFWENSLITRVYPVVSPDRTDVWDTSSSSSLKITKIDF